MNRIPRDVRKKLESSAAEIDPAFKAALKQQLFLKEGTTMAKKSSPIAGAVRYLRATPALAVFAAIVLVGTTSAFVATNRAEIAHKEEIEVPANLDDLLPLNQIRDIALADAGDNTITGIELEKEDQGLVYKVKFSDGSIRFYDAVSGEAVDVKSGDDDSVPASGFTGGLSIAEARQIASDQRPGATITKIELENEHGVVVYSVRFSDGGRVDVNAKTGDVLRVRNATQTTTSSSRDSDDDHNDDRTSSRSGSSNSGSGSSHDDDDDRSGSNSGSGSSHGGDDKDEDHSGSGKDD